MSHIPYTAIRIQIGDGPESSVKRVFNWDFWDQTEDWSPEGNFFTFHQTHLLGATIMYEYAIHRDDIRRVTVSHIMMRMGFGAADINMYATYVDDTLYRRLITDVRLEPMDC